MTPSPGPIQPHHAGSPSHVIQGFFPGGRPRIVQASPALATPVRPQLPAPVQARPASPPAPLLPGRTATGALQPSVRPGEPPRPILPTKLQPGAAQPATPLRPQAPQPILPPRAAPTAVQSHAGDALPLPANFVLKPRGSGQPLPEPIQGKMESFFNTSFADVRVHVGPEASSIGALAFTHGTDLYFSPGQYNPTSPQGQRLLGHELTHVVQQRAGRVRNPLGSGIAVVQDPALEAEAERMGLRAAISSIPLQPKLAGPTRVRTKSNPAPALIPDVAQQPLIAPRSSQRTAQATRAIMPRLLPGRSVPVIQRVKWVGAEIGKALLSQQLRNALDLAIAHPDDTPPLPDWVKTRLIEEDNRQILVEHGPKATKLADEAWGKIPSQGQSKLVKGTFISEKISKYMDMVRAGQENRVRMLLENLDGGYKWNVVFKNTDGDLPGVAGAGGYREYYAEPSPSDPPSAGFWGQNRILRSLSDGSWWATSDHYTNYIKVNII